MYNVHVLVQCTCTMYMYNVHARVHPSAKVKVDVLNARCFEGELLTHALQEV